MRNNTAPFSILFTYLLFLSLFVPATLTAQQRYFGYYANNGAIDENYQHTNITHIWATLQSPADAEALILSDLAKAKDRGIQAIVDVGSFVFDLSGDAGASGGDA